MLAGLLVAIALLAPPAGVTPAAEEPAPAIATPPAAVDTKSDSSCRTATPSADATEIVICAERRQGYRLDPDVMRAKRLVRTQPNRRSNEHMKDTACASVGPAGCIPGAGINLLGAAMTAVTMADKAIRGENIGSMFVTRPEASEYELYVAAKREREAEEAAARAKAEAAAKAATQAEAAPKL
jgi:hypothetical protein